MSTSTTTLREPASLVQWAKTSMGSAMREMSSLVSTPGMLSFALGLPATELLPLAACRVAAAQTLATDHQVLQYQKRPEPLKRHLRELLASRGVNCREDQIYLTTGAQQAIHLLVNLLLNQGGQVLLEDLTYEGVHHAILPSHPQVLVVPTDPEIGMNVDAVEAQLAQGARPAFIYTVTDGQNPLGISLSQAARNRLVALARHFQIPIIEDDVFGYLNYDGPALPPMRALDEEWVFYLGSFSKILSPALRIGWIVAPDAFGPALSFLKHASDLDVSTLAELTLSAYLDTGELPAHLAILRKEYGIRRDTMLQALESHFPPEARWTKPSSGMFIWVELPGEINTVELLKMAVETERVAFMPGAFFGLDGSGGARNGLRLNFTHCSPEQIQDGVGRLAKVLKELRG